MPSSGLAKNGHASFKLRWGRPSGPGNPEIDTAVVKEWDRRASQLAPDERRRLARVIAEDVERGPSDWATGRGPLHDRLHRTAIRGTTVVAVEQRIRLALRQRNERSTTERLMRRAFPDRVTPSLHSWPLPDEET